ncbi:2TM domain-containing protein [uncultured Winogradskyella sp.]|uniref:2TM domain-containing protein n=1 Tax=uncultured Winogradskyella sp. TaxID=395353 RepID=UPI002632CF9E|nr:2TM domain-containing protein [uncultured Winogradskyella sp.]
MTPQEEEYYRKAKDKVKRVKSFYLHLGLYIVVVLLLLYNLYIVSGPYKNNIISLDLSIIVIWTVIIVMHGLNVFKRKQIFKKSWEDKKIEGFLKEDKEEETTFWE